jgi:hypothetical protein
MRFEVYSFKTKQGIDYRIATERGMVRRVRSFFVGYLYAATKQQAVNLLLNTINGAVQKIIQDK